MCSEVICHSMLLSYGTVQLSSEFALAASRMSQEKPIHYVMCVAAAVIGMCCTALPLCIRGLIIICVTACKICCLVLPLCGYKTCITA